MVDAHSLRRPDLRLGLPFYLLAALLALLWLAGGASRADVMGQVVVRAGAWAILAAAVLAGPRPAFGAVRPVLILLLAIAALPVIQLVPMPPAMWQALPGRDVLLTPGEPVPWRPWTMAPGATRNALASLIVPAVTLVLLAQMDERARSWLPTMLLMTITAAMLLGLLQFSGARFNNPFINDALGDVAGSFANRNHFALLLAIGCVLAPIWAFRDRHALGWRGPLAVGLVLLFVLTILATGSRAGIGVGAVALVLGIALVQRSLRRRLKGAPKWVAPLLIVGLVAVIGGFVFLSFAADRAASINRLIALDNGDDMRSRGLPTVLTMIGAYLPFGSGLGSFDPVFRIHEPLDFLALTYFNHAHNDFLEIALDGGLFGIAMLAAAIGWWLWASWQAWRAQPDQDVMLARAGSAMLLLTFVASVPDYPARTPMMMAVVTIAAFWLARGGAGGESAAALPMRG